MLLREDSRATVRSTELTERLWIVPYSLATFACTSTVTVLLSSSGSNENASADRSTEHVTREASSSLCLLILHRMSTSVVPVSRVTRISPRLFSESSPVIVISTSRTRLTYAGFSIAST